MSHYVRELTVQLRLDRLEAQLDGLKVLGKKLVDTTYDHYGEHCAAIKQSARSVYHEGTKVRRS